MAVLEERVLLAEGRALAALAASGGLKPQPETTTRGQGLVRELWSDGAREQAARLRNNMQDQPGAVPEDTRLKGRRLAHTRFVTAKGAVLDLQELRHHKRVCIVILRGQSDGVCLFCASQTLAYADARAEFDERNVKLLFVYPGPAATVPIFIDAVKNLHDNFRDEITFVLDVDFALVRELGVEGDLAKPTALVLDTEGRIRHAFVSNSIIQRVSVKDMLTVLDGNTSQ